MFDFYHEKLMKFSIMQLKYDNDYIFEEVLKCIIFIYEEVHSMNIEKENKLLFG